MNLKDKLLQVKAVLTNQKRVVTLDEKVDDFIKWYEKNISYNSNDFKEAERVRNFIEKMAVWYELRYPSYEANRLMHCFGQEMKQADDIIRKNPMIDDIKAMSFDDEKYYLDSVVNALKWDGLYSAKAFISSLPYDEKRYLNRAKYPSIIYLDKEHLIHFHVTAKGRITEVECPERYPYYTLNSLVGENITLAKDILKDTEFWNPKGELESAINAYEKHSQLKEGILDCVMYRLIDRDPSRIGPRRAFMFAKEFQRNIDIPMMYGIDYSDPGLRDFISEYIKAGGHSDLLCVVDYGSRDNKRQAFELETLAEVLKHTAWKYRFTKEEIGLHQELVNNLAFHLGEMSDSQKVLKR